MLFYKQVDGAAMGSYNGRRIREFFERIALESVLQVLVWESLAGMSTDWRMLWQ